MSAPTPSSDSDDTSIKCLVWDLDQTLWNGVLSEGDNVSIKPECRSLIQQLDERGILQSIASKNEISEALAILEKEQLEQYFLYPQISWNPKSSSIQTIAKALNIGTDSIAFVDDQAYEREEVIYSVPKTRVYSAEQIPEIGQLPEFNPPKITEDAKLRRRMYKEDELRQDAESSFEGPKESFLESLEMQMEVTQATEADLDRISELTQRTHQLNTTGISFSQSELKSMLHDPTYKLSVVSLKDRFGSYGKIGLVVIRKSKQQWCIKLLLLSCRVMTRGIGNALVAYLKTQALEEGVQLHADFKATDRNRMMYITYKFAGFEELDSNSDPIQLRCDLKTEFSIPPTVEICSGL